MRNWQLVPGLLMALLFLGCESDEQSGNFWREEEASTPAAQNGNTQNTGNTRNTGNTGAEETGSTGTSAAADQAPFSSFRFTYGGFNGSGAGLSEPRIANLRISGGSMSYSWAGPTLAAWGMGNSEAGALCCLFVKNSAGAWIGGKFDWISTSRTSRSLGHVTGGYEGWTLAGVPNPCEAAFVIINANGSRRSNVIAGTWQR
jgi:hypothetical protein